MLTTLVEQLEQCRASGPAFHRHLINRALALSNELQGTKSSWGGTDYRVLSFIVNGAGLCRKKAEKLEWHGQSYHSSRWLDAAEDLVGICGRSIYSS